MNISTIICKKNMPKELKKRILSAISSYHKNKFHSGSLRIHRCRCHHHHSCSRLDWLVFCCDISRVNRPFWAGRGRGRRAPSGVSPPRAVCRSAPDTAPAPSSAYSPSAGDRPPSSGCFQRGGGGGGGSVNISADMPVFARRRSEQSPIYNSAKALPKRGQLNGMLNPQTSYHPPPPNTYRSVTLNFLSWP